MINSSVIFDYFQLNVASEANKDKTTQLSFSNRKHRTQSPSMTFHPIRNTRSRSSSKLRNTRTTFGRAYPRLKELGLIKDHQKKELDHRKKIDRPKIKAIRSVAARRHRISPFHRSDDSGSPWWLRSLIPTQDIFTAKQSPSSIMHVLKSSRSRRNSHEA